MIKAKVYNNDGVFAKDECEIEGRTILVVALNETGISANITGYVTPELLKALRRDVPKVIDKLDKENKNGRK